MDCRFLELDFIVRLKSILFLNLAVKHLVVAPRPCLRCDDCRQTVTQFSEALSFLLSPDSCEHPKYTMCSCPVYWHSAEPAFLTPF